MAHTITIETQNDLDFALLKSLAERLGLPMKTSRQDNASGQNEQQAAFRRFAGSWQGNETGDELENLIYQGRNDQSRDIEL